MKKYLIAISAILLVACNNTKSDQKPVVPDTPALPIVTGKQIGRAHV